MAISASAARRAGLLATIGLLAWMGLTATAVADTPPSAEIVVPDGELEPVVIPVGVNATDDTGVASVTLYAGIRLIGTDTEAPYSFDYQPVVQDLFGQTLIAIVTDTSGFQTTVLRRVLITNYKVEKLDAKTRYFRSSRPPYRVQTSGRMFRPDVLPEIYGCTSGIIVTYSWKGGSTSTRAGLNQRRCSFKTSSIYLPVKGRVKVTVEYLGDHDIAGIRRSHFIRIR